MIPSEIAGDRLYSLSIRPQEIELFAAEASISLSYAPICDDVDAPATQHWKLLVLELSAPAPQELRAAGLAAGTNPPARIDLLKIGWEIELRTAAPCSAAVLRERSDELPLLLEHCAAAIDDCCRRAGLQRGPITAEVITSLVHQYRTRS